MNPSVLGGGAALLLVLVWLIIRRKPVTVLRSTDASAVAALNRAQIAQVVPLAPADESVDASVAAVAGTATLSFPAAGDARGRAALLQTLRLQLQGSTPERLDAMRTAAGWGDRAVLPLLRRGLRDVDPQVVLAAAAGMASFRGRTAAPAQPTLRRVSRTR